MFHFTVQVGWTSVRPIIPDQHFNFVHLMAADDHSAHLDALLMVASRPGVEMVTSSEILKVVL